MLNHPAQKYQPYPPISLPDRRWPEQSILRLHAGTADLRDGNQALAEPMDSARKLQFWALLLSCGLKRLKWPSRRPRRLIQFCSPTYRRTSHSR